MKRIALTCLTALTLAMPGTAQANDIVDFLKAINGTRSPRVASHPQTRGRVTAPGRVRVAPVALTRQQQLRNARLQRSAQLAAQRNRSVRRVGGIGGGGLSFQVSLGGSPAVYAQAPTPVPQVPVIPQHSVSPIGPVYSDQPIVLPEQYGQQGSYVQPGLHVQPEQYQQPVLPRPGDLDHLPHEYGAVVTCPVPLTACALVRDECRIAPNAVPTVIAVRNPELGRFRSRDCIEECVYVQVMAPPCPPQRVRVSACRTKVRLDYGRYEIDVVSRRGGIEIDYDN